MQLACRPAECDRARVAVLGGAAFVGVCVLAVVYVNVEPYDPAVGAQTVDFDPRTIDLQAPPTATTLPVTSLTSLTSVTSVTPLTQPDQSVISTVAPAVSWPLDGAAAVTTPVSVPATTLPATTTTLALLPRSLVIVGDSQAHSFVVNLPDGTGDYFTVTDGSVDGCGVHDRGEVRSTLAGFGRDLADCVGWSERWGDDAARSEADVALVMLGAWDVFDVQIDDELIAFASPAFDQLWLSNLYRGIDALAVHGSQVALLEVPCMRPVANSGARVPPLPERGDDARVAHLNGLLRSVADERNDVWFVEGPDEWCDDPAISTDVDYRWDGVHVYQQGANLILSKMALSLLQIPVAQTTYGTSG